MDNYVRYEYGVTQGVLMNAGEEACSAEVVVSRPTHAHSLLSNTWIKDQGIISYMYNSQHSFDIQNTNLLHTSTI